MNEKIVFILDDGMLKTGKKYKIGTANYRLGRIVKKVVLSEMITFYLMKAIDRKLDEKDLISGVSLLFSTDPNQKLLQEEFPFVVEKQQILWSRGEIDIMVVVPLFEGDFPSDWENNPMIQSLMKGIAMESDVVSTTAMFREGRGRRKDIMKEHGLGEASHEYLRSKNELENNFLPEFLKKKLSGDDPSPDKTVKKT